MEERADPQGRRLHSVAVLGAGSWGTALAVHLARAGVTTRLWGRDSDALREIEATRENQRYLPGCHLPEGLVLVADPAAAVAGVDVVLVVVPSSGLRATFRLIAPWLAPAQRVAWATKGLEAGSAKLPHEVAREELGQSRPLAVISGPTFAVEVGRGLPTATTVASAMPDYATDLSLLLHSDSMRAYATTDMVGVAIGGAVKNVLAIGVGVSDGLGFGANTRAALITRGLSEMTRLGEALGGQRDTLTGLAGLGDLVLTCTDDQSRNRRMGLALASGKSAVEAQASIGQAVEGVSAAREVWRLAGREQVEMPITEQVYRLLYAGSSPLQAARALSGRPPRPEAG